MIQSWEHIRHATGRDKGTEGIDEENGAGHRCNRSRKSSGCQHWVQKCTLTRKAIRTEREARKRQNKKAQGPGESIH